MENATVTQSVPEQVMEDEEAHPLNRSHILVGEKLFLVDFENPWQIEHLLDYFEIDGVDEIEDESHPAKIISDKVGETVKVLTLEEYIYTELGWDVA